MSKIAVTRTLAIRLAIQALRMDVDSNAMNSEFQQIFALYGVAEAERARVRAEIVEQVLLVLSQLALALEVGKAIDRNTHLTRMLEMPEQVDVTEARKGG